MNRLCCVTAVLCQQQGRGPPPLALCGQCERLLPVQRHSVQFHIALPYLVNMPHTLWFAFELCLSPVALEPVRSVEVSPPVCLPSCLALCSGWFGAVILCLLL